MKGLTVKQEKYVQALFAGKSQREAYKTAFDCARMTDKSVGENASRLANNVKIVSRLQELNGKVEAKAIWTKEQSLVYLRNIAEKTTQCAFRKLDDTHTIADAGLLNAGRQAVAEINKILGYYAPEKHEVAGALTIDDFTRKGVINEL